MNARVEPISDTGRIRDRNRTNAKRSTGPRTLEGKAVVACNGLKHGMRHRSDVPAIPGWERLEDWHAHRDDIVRSMDPLGALETALAQRVAGLLWRLGRVVRYETERSETRYRDAEDHLHSMRAFVNPEAWDGAMHPVDVRGRAEDTARTVATLRRLETIPSETTIGKSDALGALYAMLDVARKHEVDVPEDLCFPDIPDDIPLEDFDTWTGKTLRGVVETVAAEAEIKPAAVLAEAIEESRLRATIARTVAQRSERELLDERRKRSLLPGRELERISKYEAHLQRLLERTLHELQRLQGLRLGQDVEVPRAVDVTVASGD